MTTPPERPTAPEAAPPLSKMTRVHQRITAVTESTKTRVDAVSRDLQERRGRSRRIDTVLRVGEHDVKVAGGVLAGAVAFRVFLFFVPFVFVLVSGLGLAADATGSSPADAARTAGAAGLVAQAVSGTASEAFGARLAAFVVGSFALFFAARAALKVLRTVHGLAWNVPVPKLERPTRATLLFVGFSLMLLVVVRVLGALVDSSGQGQVLGPVLMIAAVTWFWLQLSLRAFPHAEGATRRNLLPGAIAVGVGAAVLHFITVVWIARQVSSKSETYGAIGVALALLLWAYVLGRIILAAVVINASLWYRDHPAVEAG